MQFVDTLRHLLAQHDYRQASTMFLMADGKRSTHPLVFTLGPDTATHSLPAPYSGLLAAYLRFGNTGLTLPERYRVCSEALQLFLKHFSSKEGNEEMHMLKVLCEDLFLLACKIDGAALQSGGKAETLEDAARLLSRIFSSCITDRGPAETSKKWAALRVVVLLFKAYFRLTTLRLCGNIIRAMEQGEFPAITAFPKAESIAYWYYRARICIHQKEFKLAEQLLSDAFALCHPQDVAHQREILTYLVILKTIHGILPKPELLQRYSLEPEYLRLTQAVRSGNLALFDSVLAENQAFYMKKELFLLIQLHLKSLILRNLFRRIYLVSLGLPSNVESRLPLAHLEAGFRVFGMQVHIDEVECWTANLINDGYIRGYISHGSGMLVLSKKNPFPPPASLF